MKSDAVNSIAMIENKRADRNINNLSEARESVIKAAENWANQWENPEFGSKPHKRLINAVIRLGKIKKQCKGVCECHDDHIVQ